MSAAAIPIPSATDGVYVLMGTARDIVGTHPRRVKDLADAGKVRVRRVTGAHPRYNLRDLLAVVSESESGPDTAA